MAVTRTLGTNQASSAFLQARRHMGRGERGVAAVGNRATPARRNLPHRCHLLDRSPFAEGAEDLERWAADGFAAVDLETAATYAVAESFGMARLSILYVFDNPRRQEHLLLSDGEKADRRARGDHTMKQLALDLAVELCTRQGQRPSASAGGFVIRDCRAEEAGALLGLWQESAAAISHTDTLVDLRRAIVDSPAIVLVIEHEGRLIASIIGSFDGWRGNIYRLVVHPKYRRRGIARALVTEVEKRLLQQGTRRITALVETDHADATGFWTAAGYQRDPRIARFVRNL
jgi:ribosomal protein S18 acetylase RimI-like enzyme